MIYTAANFIQSPAFMEIAVEDALKTVAKTNGQTFETTRKAFDLEVPNVREAVAKLVAAAAKHCADQANAGTLWK